MRNHGTEPSWHHATTSSYHLPAWHYDTISTYNLSALYCITCERVISLVLAQVPVLGWVPIIDCNL